MKKCFLSLLVSLLVFPACGNKTPNYVVNPPAKEEPEKTPVDDQKPSGDVRMPVMGSRTVMDVDVEELSGLCLNLDNSALLACGDQGVVKLISFDGKVTDIWSRDADMEDITIDPNTEHMYIAIEGSQKVYRLDAPDYTSHSSVIYVQEAIDKDYSNSGLEGISYYKDDLLFIGSQWGANLWIYRFDGTMVSKVSLSGFADEIAGLCYDPVADWLWVVDSNHVKIYICTVDGKLLASYDLGSVDNAESICVDRDHGCVWIGSDEESPKLYRYSFTF